MALIRVADPASRLALFQTNSALHQWVLEAAPQVSVTLRGGHSEAVLQKRLAYAAQALARRGRDSKLVFHIPTPNFQALQSLLGLPEAAGRAATELDVVLSELLELPDPRGGVYDIRLSVLCAYYSEVRTLACIECLGFVRLSSKLDGRQCTVAGSSEVSTPSYMRCIFMF